METSSEWLRRMLQETGTTQAELARALNIDPTILNKMVKGPRKIMADERDRIAAHLEGVRRAGFAEEQAAFERSAGGRSPIFRARAAGSGEWIVDRGAGAIRFEPPADRAREYLDVFGFQAPDEEAWPRYKVKEIVWVCPNEMPAPGDDVFIFGKSRNRTALRGVVGELTAKSPSSIVYRHFATRESRQINAVTASIFCLASRPR
jgi:transcriptional regulator with XRE-family HTH domain